MTNLLSIFSRYEIFDERSFETLYKRLPSDFPLKQINKNNIFNKTNHYFDFTENRIYEEKVTFMNAIVDIDNLWLTDSEEIVFTNCIFRKKLTIGKREPKLKNIYIDNCIFMEELNIHSISNLSNLSIYNSNFRALNINNVKVLDSIFFSYNSFLLLSMRDTEAGIFDAIKNDIRFYESVDNIFSKLHFSYTQVRLRNIRKLPTIKEYLFQTEPERMNEVKKLYSKLKLYLLMPSIFYDIRINLFKMNNESASELATASEKYENEYTVLQTIAFLKHNTTIASDRSRYTAIRYTESLYSQKGFFRKAFTRLFGGFLKPSRILLFGFSVFLIYSMVYTNPDMVFSGGGRSLNTLEAIYFSGTTFLTIGFGDIVPISNLTRMISLSEGFFGLLTMNTFLISLVKKYID